MSADSNSVGREYLFAPYVPLQTVEFPADLVEMAGGPAAFVAMMEDIRRAPIGPHWPYHPPKDGDAQPDQNP